MNRRAAREAISELETVVDDLREIAASWKRRRNEYYPDKTAAAGYNFAMSKAELLEELLKLPKEERDEIRFKLAELDNDGWLDEDDPLTEEDKALIDKRLAEHEADPQSAIPWEEVKARLEEKFGR